MKRPSKPADLLTEIERVRGDIQAVHAELDDLALAPLPASEAKQHATAAIAHMATTFNLKGLARTLANPDYRAHGIDAVSRHIDAHPTRNEHAVLALLAVALPDALEKALHAEIDRQAGPDALSATDRAQRIEAAEQRLFELGCEEERLIVEAEAAGLIIYRRADVDPACVLGFFTTDEAA